MKQITLELNGVVRRLCFSIMAFTDYLNEATGGNTLVNGQQENTYQSAKHIIWAGLMSQCLLDGVEPDFTKEDIDKWFPMVKIKEFKILMIEFTNEMVDKEVEPGEAPALQLAGTN